MQNKQSLLLRNQIPKNWQKVKFEDLFLEPVRNGVYKKKEFHGRGQKVVNMGELFAFNFISNQDMKRVELNSSELEKDLLWDGDLLFARRSLVLEGSGKCSIVRKPNEKTTFESSIIRTRLDKKIAEPLFYYYYFKSPQGRGVMASIASQTAVSGITGNNLSQLNVPVPPKSVQLQIASILSAYDDLIENNNKQVKILEEMAQAIYKEWFVRFRFPGYEKVKMIDSPFGKIPEGWEVRKINDVVNIRSGFAFKSQIFDRNGKYKLVTIKNVQDGYFVVEYKDLISDLPHNLPTYCLLSTGDILLSLTGNVGRVCLVYGDNYLLNQRVAKLEPKVLRWRGFVYLLFRQAEFRTIMERTANGSAQQNLSPIETAKINIVTPNDATIDTFSHIVNPLLEKILILYQTNLNLRGARDLLLPKLMRKEIMI